MTRAKIATIKDAISFMFASEFVSKNLFGTIIWKLEQMTNDCLNRQAEQAGKILSIEEEIATRGGERNLQLERAESFFETLLEQQAELDNASALCTEQYQEMFGEAPTVSRKPQGRSKAVQEALAAAAERKE